MTNALTMKASLMRHKHAFFLGSLVALLIADVFFVFEYKRLVIFACLLINMSLSLVLISHKKRWVKSLFLVIILLTFSRIIATLVTNIQAIDRIGEFFSGLYFLCIAIVLFYDLYKEKNLKVDTLFAVFSGFILLCYAFGFALMFMNKMIPDSIWGLDSGAILSDYVYFSFITLLTIGYGDIYPRTEVAKKVIVFASLIGHFYTVFVTAIIVGKLLMTNAPEEDA